MNKKCYLAAAFLIASASPCLAHQWKHLGTNEASDYYYLNPKTLQVKEGIASAWTKREFEVDAKDAAAKKLPVEKYKGKRTVVSYEEYDCAGGKKKTVSGMRYDNEQKEQRDLEQAGWQKVPADGVERSLFEAVCKEAKEAK